MKALIHTGILITITGFLSGCLLVEDTGTSESVGTPVTQPADFEVSDGGPSVPPPDEGDNSGQPTEPDPETIEEGFFINNGATRTAASELQLRLITLNRFQVKITTNLNCSGGAWEPYSESKTIPTPVTNGLNTVSVQFKDWDGRATHCYRQTITHDGVGPAILFTKYPAASLEEGATAELIAEVTDAGTVDSVTCRLNGLEKPCLSGRNEVSITALPAGDYEFAIRARDDLGNESESNVTWSVVSLSKRLTQGIRVNDYKKVDILMVVDNSGSMEYEQRNMAQRTSKLLSVIRGLDYQIAVTTTDPREVTLGDGRLLPITGGGGRYIIDSTQSEATAQQQLSATLQRPETGGSAEQGIRAAYRAIERFNMNESRLRAFFRDGAQFAVVLISDEDESANTAKNDPQNLVKLVHDSFDGQKMFGYHSIITKPGDTACKSTHGATYGERYKTMSELTGGIIGSVCASDYSTQVTGIAEGIRNLLKTMTLQCVPLPEKGLTIRRDGVIVSDSYRIEGVNLRFDAELVPGEYSVEYSCLK